MRDNKSGTTIVDIAKSLNLSHSTVSRVLNNKKSDRIPQSTRERVFAAAREMNYRPNVLARGLKINKSSLVGVIVNSISSSFYSVVIEGIERAADKVGYNIILCTVPEQASLRRQVDALFDKRVDGIILGRPESEVELPIYRELVARGMPVLSCGYHHVELDVPFVMPDNTRGGYLATKHLISKGHTRIAFLGCLMDISANKDRYIGYCEALQEAGIPINEEYRIFDAYDTPYAENAVFIDKLLDLHEPPTAAFAFTDMTAIAVIKQLQERGLSIPEDFSVVGFDDMLVSSLVTPSITTIRQPKSEWGVLAFEKLYELIQENTVESVLVDVELVERASVARLCQSTHK